LPIIIHTADVHLSTKHPHRTDALRVILDLAAEVDADAVTIGGDLFDSHQDAHDLRADLRDLLSGVGRPILVIPGNHDQWAFSEELHYGADGEVLHRAPYHVRDLGNIRLVAVPYQETRREEVLLALREREPFEGNEVLLIHCSLDLPKFDQGVGDEERYFPVSSEVLAELDFSFYLAGHYHGGSKQVMPNGAPFVYPGSPCSVTRRELGRRYAAVVDTTRDVELRLLPTFYYDRLAITVSPGQEEGCLETVGNWIKERAEDDEELEIYINGFLYMPEKEFAVRLGKVASIAQIHNRCSSVVRVLADPLFQEFERRLGETELETQEREALYERALRAFARMQASRA